MESTAKIKIKIFADEAQIFLGSLYIGRIYKIDYLKDFGFFFDDASETSQIPMSHQLSPHVFAQKCAELLDVNVGMFKEIVEHLNNQSK